MSAAYPGVVAMTAPMLADAQVTQPAGLAIALALGAAFGFLLERGGMTSARKLTAQFQLRDFTVIKVMFSALVTAMLGTFWLARIGVLDLSAVYVPHTFLLPQAVGGLIFGAGFAVGGLCPGTACAAAATGKIDGVAVMAGMFGGIFTFAAVLPRIEPFFLATASGRLTLPGLSGISYGAVVAMITASALLMFAAVDRHEGAAR